MERKHKHGFWQPIDLVQGLPHAAGAAEDTLSWRTESALAETTAVNIAANNIFLSMATPFLSGT
jgi:hypothetical protein